jgi:hypothetical protein
MREMKKILLLSALCLVAFGCQEDRLPGEVYSKDNYVYFLSGTGSYDPFIPHIATLTDRNSSYWTNTYDIDVKFDVMPLGRMSDQDRPVRVVFANEGAENFPPAGAFETIPALDQLKIAANGAGTPLTVRLKWNKELFLANKGAKWQIVLECRENEYFKVWPETTGGINSTTGEMQGEPLSRFTINFGVSPTFN